jgi:ribonucleoside-diphosphate reductase alpha chain
MLRVIRNHRRAAYGAAQDEFEGITSHVMSIDQSRAPLDMLLAARESWDLALNLGEQYGYRNAQASVLAPTGCLVGGSLVPTERGLVRLRSLGDPDGAQWQDLDVEVGTDEGVKTATRFYINGVEPVVTVDTARGYRIQGTPTHRIKVVNSDTGAWEWRRFGDVRPDDLIPLQMKQLVGAPRVVTLPPLGDMYWTGDFATRVPDSMSPELAEFVGYFMGDGSLHAKGLRLAVAGSDFDVVERLRLLGKELFNLEAKVSDRTGYTEVAFNSVPLTAWWEACGFARKRPVPGHAGKGWHPQIPDAVLASNDAETYRAFVRGLFEADGTVTNGYPTWSTTSIAFSRDVQSLLLAIGFPTTRRFDTTGWGNSPIAVLRTLDLGYSAQFADEIGFMGDRKEMALASTTVQQASRMDHIPVPRAMVDRLAPANDALRKTMLTSLAKRGMVSRRSVEALYERNGDPALGHLLGFFYDRVDSAELGDEQWTYDLSVPENVTYVANGFVSHNTIGLLMDCDTTGVEPDFALVKFKKLAGGGYFKIVNQSVAPSLRHLGYTTSQIGGIVTYIVGTSSLQGAPHVNRDTLTAKGLTAEEIGSIEKTLATVFELRHAFNVFVVGEAALQRLGFEVDEYTSWDFDLLKALGYTRDQIAEANDVICGRQTIEGAPNLAAEHLSVFDTANKNGKYGTRYIHHTGHIKMMAAAQPFISGAISKTINMPNEVSTDDIEDAYRMSWELGLKAMALYRDGSKAVQPLNSTSDDASSDEENEELTAAHEVEKALMWGHIPAGMSPTEAYRAGMRPPRFLLPSRRAGFNQEARIGGHKVYLRTGEYEDGTLGEIFIDLAKEGATLKGILSCFAIAVSKGLQYGVPLDEFVNTFTFQTFEPRGMVEGHPHIKMSNSIVDYVFRALGVEYLHRDELAQVPPVRDMELPEPKAGMAAEAGDQPELFDAAAEHDVDAVARAARFVDGPVTAPETQTPERLTVTVSRAVDAGTASMNAALGDMMGDAPLCDTCGHITVRNGSCYKCLNCGNSLGCS